jgi:putative nucleotidyltransferase with HDIG domain
VLAVPLRFGEESRGILLLVHRLAGSGSFTGSDLELSASLSQQGAICLANAAFHETQINYFTHTIELLVLSMEGSIVPRRHLHNVASYAGILSRKLQLDDAERRRLHFAALLHDIGMIKIPADLKSVPEHYQLHPVIGAEMVSRIVLWNDLVPIIQYHHENFDGSGYPDRLAGDVIPLGARIVAIGESFDAMTNPESYRTALDFDNALDELRRGAGTRYDPLLVELFATEIKNLDSR